MEGMYNISSFSLTNCSRVLPLLIRYHEVWFSNFSHNVIRIYFYYFYFSNFFIQRRQRSLFPYTFSVHFLLSFFLLFLLLVFT